MKEKVERKWKLEDVKDFILNSLMAILQGKFLLRLGISRYLIHILYCFFMLCMAIWISLMIETTMTKVETNKESLYDKQMILEMKKYEFSSLKRRTTVERLLQENGSTLAAPEKPATLLEK